MDITSSYIVCIVGVILLLGIIKLGEVLFPPKSKTPPKSTPLTQEDLVRIRKECEKIDNEIEEDNYSPLTFDNSINNDTSTNTVVKVIDYLSERWKDWEYFGEPIHISDFREQHGEEHVIDYYGQHAYCFKDGTIVLFSNNLEESKQDKSCLYIRECHCQGIDEVGFVAYNDRGVIGDTIFADDDNANLYLDEGIYSRDGLTILHGRNSFYSFEIFKGTKNIADRAFSDFYENGILNDADECLIEKIIIPTSVINIGSAPFGSNLNTVICNSQHFKIDNNTLFTSDFKRLIQCFDKTDEGEYIVPDSVEEIGDLAFYCCMFKRIVIGKSVNQIGKNPFVSNMSGCELICKTNKFVFKDGSLLDVNNNLISYLGEEMDYAIPDGVKAVGDYAFRYCKLSTLTLPLSLCSVTEHSFNNLKVSKVIVSKGSKGRFISLLPSFANKIVEE